MRSILLAITLIVTVANSARADIFQWEYIDPADPTQGKRQSTMLAPDGAGVDAVPGSYLAYRDLTMGYLSGEDLTNAYLAEANLTDADLRQANLSFAYLGEARLANADFTGAEVRGASLYGTGLTANQLYSTASYQAQDLAGVSLSGNLSGWNFARQDLSGAYFAEATLTDADFSDAHVQGTYFGYSGLTLAQLYSTASYQARDLSGVDLRGNDLSGADFAYQKLAEADFSFATLTGADFTGADVRGATLGNRISLTQLYSTASYKARDLTGIGLAGDLRDANFAGLVLVDATFTFFANLTGANFREANIANADFSDFFCWGLGCKLHHANLMGADLTAADARGVKGLNVSDATTSNLIRPDGHIQGLVLDAGGRLVVRDYDGDSPFAPGRSPIPIIVDQHVAMGAGSTLRMVFEADAWDSTISFAPGIPVALGGTLELTFAADVDLAGQIGRSFQLFDWTGVSPTGTFSVSSDLNWNLTKLYTTGEVTLMALPEPSTFVLLGCAALTALSSRTRGSFKSDTGYQTCHASTSLSSCSLSW